MNAEDLCFLAATDLARRIHVGEFSALEVTDSFLGVQPIPGALRRERGPVLRRCARADGRPSW